MTQLSLLLTHSRETLATELARAIREAIQDSQGFSGTIIKGALKTAEKAKPNILQLATNRLLPDILETLQPHWDDFSQSDAPDFGTYLNTHSDNVIDQLLKVFNRGVEKLNRSAVTNTYTAIKGKIAGVLKPHLPLLGDILEAHIKALPQP
ncbi:DUF6918 family protein [Corynebacterium sp. HS2168-gen11]|uniref:DUF6918 family protein n=1 Tax=Corynebacterium sp. HS2168-gen11 TaxID=2974027 RepID=UPI00216AE210|nr:hypothetical protein [Corynebacterium sp. HS2168-gen11]MCS4535496.1 hypothetical protein [Corynebacterium sp. HS2168-gen11]